MPALKFCILDADYITEGEGRSERPVIRIWGKTREGKSVLVLDRTFEPYFYVQPRDGLSESELKLLAKRILQLRIEGKGPKRVEKIKGRKFLGKPIKILRVIVGVPPDVPKFRELLKEWRDVEEEYEYGVNFYKRYLIDKKLTPMGWAQVEGREAKPGKGLRVDVVFEASSVKPLEENGYPKLRVLAFDLELVEERGKEKIIMISMMDNKGFKKALTIGKKKTLGVEVLGSEGELIKRFIELVQKRNPEVIAAYNSDRFDFPKLQEKAEGYRIPLILSRDGSHVTFRRSGRVSAADIKGRIHIDIFDFIEHILRATLSSEVLTLDMVAKELIGEGKEDMEWKDIEKAWKKKDLKSIASYCLQDSNLALKLADNLLPQIFELSKVVGQTPFDVSRHFYSQLVEWVLIRKAFDIGEIVPNRPKYDEVMRRRKVPPYVGGYVQQPKEGIHDNIALFDFQSLYPSITITHNVSPETLDCKDCKVNERNQVPDLKHHFCGKHNGFVPRVIEELVKKRVEIKEKLKRLGERSFEYRALYNRQYALKIIANASYGYYGYAGSRWYSRVCAESITSWGRMYIKKVISMAEKMKYNVIYGDTDSLFVKIKTRKEARKFLEKVNSKLPGIMELDFRDLYESGIFVLGKTGLAAKKRYALIDKKGVITIRGFEKVRRDWANIARDTQENILKAILKDKSPAKAVRIVRRIIDNLKKGKVEFDDLIIYTQLTKPIEKYEQIGPHVLAAKKMRAKGMAVHEGSTIAYVITKGTGSISERAEPAEGADVKDYDPDYYTNNQVIPAAMRVLSGLGYKEEDLLSKKRLEQVSLSKFVKK